MGKLIRVEIVMSESNEGLTRILNGKISKIHSDRNEAVINYVPPVYDLSKEKILWSALLEEHIAHPFD